jgi:nitroreductase
MAHINSVIETTPIFGKMIKKMNLTKSKLATFFWFNAKIWGGKSWVTHQLYLAIGFILAACAQNKIGALPMEGIFTKKIDKILKEPSHFKTVAAIAVGYPHIDDINNPSKLQKARLPKELVTKLI